MGILRERRVDTMGEGLGVEREEKGGYYEGRGEVDWGRRVQNLMGFEIGTCMKRYKALNNTKLSHSSR